MKITIVTNGFPPQRWAGTETYSAGIASFLANNGHQFNVICAGEWEDGPNNVNGFSHDYYNGIGVYRINLNWTKGKDPFTYLYNNPEVSSLLSRLLNDTKPDIIHVTSCETLSASLFGVAKKLGIPLVLTLTDFWFICPRINLLKSNGENCSGSTTAWECLRCQLLDSKVFRFPNEFLPEYLVSKLFMSISKNSSITKQRGLRGFAGDMEKRKKFLSQAIYWPDVRITASQFVSDIFLDHFNDLPITLLPYGHDLSWIKEGLHKAEFKR